MQLSTMEAATRVYAELLRMAQPDEAVQDLWVIKPLPPLRVLAGEVSASRAVVSDALNELYSSGLLRRKGESLYLLQSDSISERNPRISNVNGSAALRASNTSRTSRAWPPERRSLSSWRRSG